MTESHDFQTLIRAWAQKSAVLDRKLRPIAEEEVDLEDPDWEEKLAAAPHPADQAGVREEVKALFEEIIDRFPGFDAEERREVIDLAAQRDALMFAVALPAARTPEGLRRWLIFEVIKDQGKDTRDFLVALPHYRSLAESLGVDAGALFREMAEIADARDKYGWGSTREIFLKNA